MCWFLSNFRQLVAGFHGSVRGSGVVAWDSGGFIMGSTDLGRDCDNFAPGFEQHVALNSGSLMWESASYNWDSDTVGRDSGDIPKGSGGLVRDSGGLARDSNDFVRGSGSLVWDSTIFIRILGVWRGIPTNGSFGVPAVWRGIPDGFFA